MKSMGGVNRLPVEKYSCVDCEKDYNDEEVRNTWRCPVCNEYIYVYAEGYNDPNNHITIIRKRASEINKGDLVLLPGQLDGESYMVLGITPVKDKLGIGLKGYTQLKVNPEEPINCRVGSW